MTFFKQFGFTGETDTSRNKETEQLLAKDLIKSIDIQPNMTLKSQTSYTGTRQNLSREQDHKADQQQAILAIKQQVQQQQHKLESKLALLKQVSNIDGISTPLNLGSQKPTRMQSRLLDYKLRYAERTNREDYYRNRANQLSDQLGYYNTFNTSDEKSVSALKTQQQEVDLLRTQVEKMQAQMALLHKELESKEVTLQQHILIVDNLQQVVQQQQAKQIDQQEEFLQLNDRYSKQLQIAQAATIAKSKIELELAELHDSYLKIKSENLDMERKYNQMSSEMNAKNTLIEQLQTELERQTKKAQEKKEQLKQYQQLNIQLQQQQQQQQQCPKKNIQRRMVQVSSSLKDHAHQKENYHQGSDEESQQEKRNDEHFFRRDQQLNYSTEMRPEIDLSMKTESQVNETIENNQQNLHQLSMKEFGSDIYSKIHPNESQNIDIDTSKNQGISFRQFKRRSSNQTPDQLKLQQEVTQDQKSNMTSQHEESIEEASNEQLPSNVLSESKPSMQEGLTELGMQAILDNKNEQSHKVVQANDISRKAEQVEAKYGLDEHNAKLQLQEKVQQKLQCMFGQEVKLSTPEQESLTDKTIAEQQAKLLQMKKSSEQISQFSKELSEAVSKLENDEDDGLLQNLRKSQQPLSQAITNIIYKLENGEVNKQDLTEEQQEELMHKGYDVIIHQSQLNEDFTNNSLQLIINKINNNEELPDLSESQEIQLKQMGYDIGPKVVQSQILINDDQQSREQPEENGEET